MQVILSSSASEKVTDYGPRFLSFYQDPPQGEVTLDQLEGAALDRMTLLQRIEQFPPKFKHDSVELHPNLTTALNALPLKDEDGRFRDTVSHYALRLAYARPQDREWFMKQESTLLHIRLSVFESKALAEFLRLQKLHIPATTSDEFSVVREDLLDLERAEGYNVDGLSAPDFFRVRFEKAPELLRRRVGLLRGGYLHIHKRHLLPLVCAHFRTILSAGLARTYQALPQVHQQEDRLVPLLSALTRRITDVDYRAISLAPGERVRPADIDPLSSTSFPLCMKNLHQALRSHHHLKHGGRLQYGLFLKGIGLSLEDALEFWRSEFTRKMPQKTFDASYSYNIRHNYGKEGKGSDYNPFSCDKIIAQKITPDDCHGCPFKAWEKEQLLATVRKVVLKEGESQAIVDDVKKKGPQQACARYFEATHPDARKLLELAGEEVIVKHPNNYYKLSRAYWQKKEATKVDSTAVVTQTVN